MKNDMTEKIILLVDGEPLEGLVNMDEPGVEYGVVPVPGRNKIVNVADGVKTIPAVPGVFKITRNSKTLKFLQTWFTKKETHECVRIRTDGSGKEFSRELWQNTELSKLNGPGYDAASPVFAQQLVTFLPEDVIPIDPEG